MASNLLAKGTYYIAMASCLIAMASNLVARLRGFNLEQNPLGWLFQEQVPTMLPSSTHSSHSIPRERRPCTSDLPRRLPRIISTLTALPLQYSSLYFTLPVFQHLSTYHASPILLSSPGMSGSIKLK